MTALADEHSLGDRAFVNVFAGSFFRFAIAFSSEQLVSFFRGRHFYSKNYHFRSCVGTKTARSALVG